MDSSGRIKEKKIDYEAARKFLGGKGYTAYLLYLELKEIIKKGVRLGK